MGFRLIDKGLTHPGLRPPLPRRGCFGQFSLSRTQVLLGEYTAQTGPQHRSKLSPLPALADCSQQIVDSFFGRRFCLQKGQSFSIKACRID